MVLGEPDTWNTSSPMFKGQPQPDRYEYFRIFALALQVSTPHTWNTSTGHYLESWLSKPTPAVRATPVCLESIFKLYLQLSQWQKCSLKKMLASPWGSKKNYRNIECISYNRRNFYWSALFFRCIQQQIEIYTILPKKDADRTTWVFRADSRFEVQGLPSHCCNMVLSLIYSFDLVVQPETNRVTLRNRTIGWYTGVRAHSIKTARLEQVLQI